MFEIKECSHGLLTLITVENATTVECHEERSETLSVLTTTLTNTKNYFESKRERVDIAKKE